MKILTAAILIGMTLAAGSAMAQPAPYAPIPPPQFEGGPPPPPPGAGPNWVLEPGHWHWNGFRYVWVGRHWIVRHAGWSHFVPGHWSSWGGGWHWVPGHWA